MDLGPLFIRMVILILIMGIGYALGKAQYIDPHTKRKLTKVLLTVTSPCMIVDAFLDNVEKADSLGLFSMVGKSFLAGGIMYAALVVLALPLVYAIRSDRENRPLYIMMAVFGNIGFMGFPVISAVSFALWGEGSESVGLFYGAIFCSLFNILVYTLGVWLMTRGKSDGKKISLKLLLSPGVISCTVGLILFLLRVRVPEVIGGTLDSVGALTGTLAMILVGVNLSEMPAKEMIRDRRTLVFALLRQTVLPLIVWVLVKWLLPGDGEMERLRVLTFVMSAMPVANMASLFATEYGSDESLAGRGVFVTTVLSVVTIPVLLALCL